MTSIISAAHRNHTRVVLTVQSFGWSTSRAGPPEASLLGSATARAEPRPADRRRRPRSRRRRRQPRLRAARPRLRRASSRRSSGRSGAELNRIHRGYQLTFDTLGSIGNYPIEDATASGGADAVFVMGYDYRTASSSPVGSIAPLDRTGYDIRDTIAAYTARVPPSKVILGVPVLRPRLVDEQQRPPRDEHERNQVRRLDDRRLRHRRRLPRRSTAASTTRPRASRGPPTSARTAPRRTAASPRGASSTSTTRPRCGAKYDLVNSYGLRGAGIWALGYDGTRTELWAAIQRKFVTDTTAAGVRRADPAGRRSSTRGSP